MKTVLSNSFTTLFVLFMSASLLISVPSVSMAAAEGAQKCLGELQSSLGLNPGSNLNMVGKTKDGQHSCSLTIEFVKYGATPMNGATENLTARLNAKLPIEGLSGEYDHEARMILADAKNLVDFTPRVCSVTSSKVKLVVNFAQNYGWRKKATYSAQFNLNQGHITSAKIHEAEAGANGIDQTLDCVF